MLAPIQLKNAELQALQTIVGKIHSQLQSIFIQARNSTSRIGHLGLIRFYQNFSQSYRALTQQASFFKKKVNPNYDNIKSFDDIASRSSNQMLAVIQLVKFQHNRRKPFPHLAKQYQAEFEQIFNTIQKVLQKVCEHIFLLRVTFLDKNAKKISFTDKGLTQEQMEKMFAQRQKKIKVQCEAKILQSKQVNESQMNQKVKQSKLYCQQLQAQKLKNKQQVQKLSSTIQSKNFEIKNSQKIIQKLSDQNCQIKVSLVKFNSQKLVKQQQINKLKQQNNYLKQLSKTNSELKVVQQSLLKSKNQLKNVSQKNIQSMNSLFQLHNQIALEQKKLEEAKFSAQLIEEKMEKCKSAIQQKQKQLFFQQQKIKIKHQQNQQLNKSFLKLSNFLQTQVNKKLLIFIEQVLNINKSNDGQYQQKINQTNKKMQQSFHIKQNKKPQLSLNLEQNQQLQQRISLLLISQQNLIEQLKKQFLQLKSEQKNMKKDNQTIRILVKQKSEEFRYLEKQVERVGIKLEMYQLKYKQYSEFQNLIQAIFKRKTQLEQIQKLITQKSIILEDNKRSIQNLKNQYNIFLAQRFGQIVDVTQLKQQNRKLQIQSKTIFNEHNQIKAKYQIQRQKVSKLQIELINQTKQFQNKSLANEHKLSLHQSQFLSTVSSQLSQKQLQIQKLRSQIKQITGKQQSQLNLCLLQNKKDKQIIDLLKKQIQQLHNNVSDNSSKKAND